MTKLRDKDDVQGFLLQTNHTLPEKQHQASLEFLPSVIII